MRSVYAKILLWCTGVLVLSLAAFIAISIYVSFLTPGKNLFRNTNALQLEEATEAFESGGARQLSLYLGKVDRIFHAEHFLVDPGGKDLVTGEDRTALLTRTGRDSLLGHFRGGGDHVIVRPSADGRYRYLVRMPSPVDFSSSLPYYLLILVAIAALCWLLAVNIAS